MISSVEVRLARRVGTRLLSATLLGSLSLPLVVLSQTAHAEAAQQISFSIPAGSLSGALAAFGRQSGMQISYPPEIAAGKTSAGISSTTTSDVALTRLLQGSGLQASFSGNNTVTLNTAPAFAAADDALMLGTITVTAKAGGTPADAPYESAGSSAYISGAQVDRFRGTSVGDFLSGVPGVLNGDARNSGALDVNIRGLQGQGRVPVIVDGSSQETTIYQGYNGSNARSYIDPDFIGSVSIEKGASMGADATGAIGGVVRVSTIGVQDILLPGESVGVRIKGGFNGNSASRPAEGTRGGFQKGSSIYDSPSYDKLYPGGDRDRPGLFDATGGSGSLAVAGTTEFVDVVAAYAQRYNGNYYSGKKGGDGARPTVNPDNGLIVNSGLSPYREGEQVLNTSLDNESWLLKAKLKMVDNQTLDLGYSKYISDYGYQLGSTLFTTAGYYQGQLSNITLDTWTARYHWQPEETDLINLRVNTFYNKVDNRANSTTLTVSTGVLTTSAMRVGSERWGGTVSNTSLFNTPAGDVSLEYGGGYTREDVGSPDGIELPDIMSSQPQPRQGNRRERSAFTTLEYKPQDWLTLNGNLRYQHYKTIDNASTLAEPFERTDKGWSRIVSATVEPIEGFKPYVKYSNVMRNPSIFESLTSPSFGYALDKNPVKPERARTYEAGINFLRDGVMLKEDKLRLHAAYFDNKIDDYITRSNIPFQTPFFTFYTLGRVNLQSAEMRGFEVSAEYDSGQVFGSVAWNHYTHIMFCAAPGTINPAYTQCAPGGIYNSFAMQQVPPKDTVTFNLGSRFLDDKLTIGSRLNWIGSRYTIGIGDGSENSTQSLGLSSIQASRWNPYALVDLYASYQLNKNASFDLNLDNLTDRFYIDAMSITPQPGPGRTLRGSVTLKF
ncbi:TonB-dependent receptor domain-containing protein [Pseudomonas graminis]